MRFNISTLVLLFSLGGTALFAQPANDECIDAIQLNDVTSWCSSVAAFSNVDATPSASNPSCFPNTQVSNDIWFSFVAVATDVNIAVIGNQPFNSGGTLQNPQFALFSGDCNGLTEIGCQSDAFGENIAQAFNNEDLIVGQTYYIQISARDGNEGTFELCVNNFNQVPEPSGDCETGVILCDKSPFTVEFINGAGSVTNELNGLSCPTCINGSSESASTWYRWTCDDPGSLAFTLTPLNPSDDLDFVIFELPNGIDDCANKNDLRCMASGENVGSPFDEWSPCTGATGLMEGDEDASEDCGCQPGDNNFAGAIQMVEGASYALVINNFSNSGSGFSIEFGGTGTFLGPTAGFTTDDPDNLLCVGESITFSDASSYIGTISNWVWNFGPDATPGTATGQGPHTVSYDRPGIKSVVLRIETEEGCFITEIAQIEVECCSDHFDVDDVITDLVCLDDPTGAIDLTVTNDYGPYIYDWESGENTEDISGLELGEYMITITDQATCDTVLTYMVGGPEPFTFDTLITMPTCNGGTDGSLTLNVDGGTPPYQFNFEGNGFSPNNTLSNISQGDYEVVIQDANGCEETQIIEVRELELVLDPAVQAITPPTCNGFSDGSIIIDIVNGQPPYQYDFNDGNGFVDENSLQNIAAGTYIVEVLDDNLCMGTFELVVQDPPPLEINFDVIDASCFGEEDGSIIVMPEGGVGGYSLQWNTGDMTDTLSDLPAGQYTLTLLDANACELTQSAEVFEPDPVFIEVLDVVDVICNGDSTGQITVLGSGGVPPYMYSADGEVFQSEPILGNLTAGDYTLTIMDAQGCMAITTASITEPPALLVDAGPDQFVELGFSTSIRAVANEFPVTYRWTPDLFLECDSCAQTQVIAPTGTTTYTMTVTNEDGCTAVDSLTIFVIRNRPVYIPNVFSPNDDGFNDNFTVFSGPAVAEILNIKIFDRWGELIFENENVPTNSESEGWDGTFKGEPMGSGVYVYLIDVAFIDGQVIQYEGDVTLLR